MGYVGEAGGGSEDEPGGRDAQQVKRVAEMHAVMACIDEVVAAAVRDVPTTDGAIDASGGVGGARGTLAPRAGGVGGYAHALPVDTRSITLMGHSFGGSTALRVAAEMEGTAGPMRVRAVIASDPWICGYDHTKHGITTAPTLALCVHGVPTRAPASRLQHLPLQNAYCRARGLNPTLAGAPSR